MYRLFIRPARTSRSLTLADVDPPPNFTELQGQYLAFIHAYWALNRRASAEADMQRFFRVTPPSVHRMVLQLDNRGLIRRSPGAARSIELMVPCERLPPLRCTQPIKNPVQRY
jgi:DNA-binding MarR family transcriptional regulator